MEWDRSETLALAQHDCTLCLGVGTRTTRKGETRPCPCVTRAIFRACYARFRHCVEKERTVSRVSLEYTGGRQRRVTWGRKDEEYIADFCQVSRKHLDASEYRIFNYHFLLGADWRLCCRKLKMDRGSFFHMVYRIQQKLGQVFRELEPYGLYPLDEYFQGKTVQEEKIQPRVVPIRETRQRLQAPLRKSA